MPDTNRNQSESPLVRSVNALDANFFELIRLGNKIDEINLKSDTDYEQLERLLKRFAEYGDGVSSQIVLMSQALTDSRAQAEAVAQAVSIKAALLHERKVAEQKKMEQFRLLGEKVRELSSSLMEFKELDGAGLSEDDKKKMSARLADLELSLRPLIDEATSLRKEGHSLKMKVLEQNADSLTQSLTAVSKKLSGFQLEKI
jgi:hypothetical protein